MKHFTEHSLEMALMTLMEGEGYTYTHGQHVHKTVDDVLLRDDLKVYLRDRYQADGITAAEVERAMAEITANRGFTLYERNAATLRLLTEGFSLKRDDASLPNLFVEPIDFRDWTKNIFRVVNQLEIQGRERRIPDAVVFVNGLPLVVVELKSAVKENATLTDAYRQLTVRYRRDIQDLFKYNAFVCISDGVNSKYGSLFAPYEYFYSWRKAEPTDKDADGFDSLSTMVRGLLRPERLLQGRESGGVFLTTIQKFTEDTRLLSDRANIVCISDEAHRSQTNLQQQVRQTDEGVRRSYGFAKHLHTSLPRATYVGFTGTPVDATIDVFGPVVEGTPYTMTESVADGITRPIVYEGRAARVMLDPKKMAEIEAYYKQCADDGANAHQIEESKKAMTRMDAILGDPDLLRRIADDFVAHYERRIEEGSTVEGKAMIVCSNRRIAFMLYKDIIALRPEWAVKPQAEERPALGMAAEPTPVSKDAPLPLERVQLVMTRNKDDERELYDLLGNDESRQTLATQFKQPRSNFKIAIVVDMWLTGFDVPCLDTMYVYKPLQQHTLIQTISRVNRVYPGKEKGLVVDYLGIKSNLNAALKKYATSDEVADDMETTAQSVTMVKNELDLLRRMFAKVDYSRFSTGTPLEQLACLNEGAEFVQATEKRETLFMGHVAKMKKAYNLCTSSDELTDQDREDIHFFTGIRSIIRKLTKGDAPDASQMNQHVARLVEEAVQSECVEEITQIANDREHIDLLSEEYMERLAKLQMPNTRVKLMRRLLEMVITDFKRVNKMKGVDFTKRLNAIVARYNDRSDDAVFADEVLTEVASQMADLLAEVNAEKQSFKQLGISYEEKAFYDILKAIARKFAFDYPEDKLLALSAEIKKIVDDKSHYTDWSARDDIKAELKMDLILVLAEHGYPPVTNDEVFKEIFEQAENFKKYNA